MYVLFRYFNLSVSVVSGPCGSDLKSDKSPHCFPCLLLSTALGQPSKARAGRGPPLHEVLQHCRAPSINTHTSHSVLQGLTASASAWLSGLIPALPPHQEPRQTPTALASRLACLHPWLTPLALLVAPSRPGTKCSLPHGLCQPDLHVPSVPRACPAPNTSRLCLCPSALVRDLPPELQLLEGPLYAWLISPSSTPASHPGQSHRRRESQVGAARSVSTGRQTPSGLGVGKEKWGEGYSEALFD